MRSSECCIIHLVLYGIIQYYTAQSAKIPIIQTHNDDTILSDYRRFLDGPTLNNSKKLFFLKDHLMLLKSFEIKV